MEEKKYYVIFADELAGGYGFWILGSYESIERSLSGEKYLREEVDGSFPCEKTEEATKLLEEICRDFYSDTVREKIDFLEAL